MLRSLMALAAILALALSISRAADTPTDDQRAKIAAIVSAMAGDVKSLEAAEDALAAEGPTILPALREKLAALAQSQQGPLGEAYKARFQASVLDGAIIRLTWDLNPRKLISEWVAKLKDFNGEPFAWRVWPFRITDEPVARAFPAHLVFTMLYPSYPVARILPESLSYQNIFVVAKDGALTHLTDPKGLETFFRASLAPIKDCADGEQVIYAWLRVSQEFSQDGMFRFSIPRESLRCVMEKDQTDQPSWYATGKAVVEPTGGNRGEITATLTFDAKGKLLTVSETRGVRAGMRPICQATKLLDADPIVRGMAEQDLLVMGRAAEGYLIEQRATAGPELRQAIDRLWARIIAEGR